MALSDILPYILTPAGIVRGWGLNSLSKQWEYKKDVRKIRNRVLFNLLEIHFQLTRPAIDFSTLFPIIEQKLKEVFPAAQLPDGLVQATYGPMIKAFMKSEIAKQLEELQTKYHGSVEMLAEADPIIAYYLHGQIRASRLYEQWMDDMFENIDRQFPTSEAGAVIARQVKDVASSSVSRQQIGEFRKHILDIASGLGRKTRKKTRRILQVQGTALPDEQDLSAMQAIFSGIQQALEKMDVQNAGLAQPGHPNG